ncbi:hypothetical protein [Paracoccus pantotrophus]|uniref:Uncharacterized protein n=1 Tax=Paracoccus pantotrophus TaxID=82367 RepID=A0A7H9C0D3_PARPN|nr:hypothetical protein [Paracoccus pantotrophus]MDF3855607.1 hypothetical protein [Paracoccus pantotrophus]QLH17067.1 hypothetical protein HYQ43_22870 [Paracoccus pantotrophus]SFP22410.1 hypothetical protein SAMN04244567_04032 [Paracoccus pantotrophus]
MIVLTDAQAQALKAFLETFDLHASGVWPEIEEGMREDFGIENPASAVEDLQRVLSGQQS